MSHSHGKFSHSALLFFTAGKVGGGKVIHQCGPFASRSCNKVAKLHRKNYFLQKSFQIDYFLCKSAFVQTTRRETLKSFIFQVVCAKTSWSNLFEFDLVLMTLYMYLSSQNQKRIRFLLRIEQLSSALMIPPVVKLWVAVRSSHREGFGY